MAAWLQAYAMTEASHQMTSNPLPKHGPHKAGTVGRAQGSVKVLLLSHTHTHIYTSVKIRRLFACLPVTNTLQFHLCCGALSYAVAPVSNSVDVKSNLCLLLWTWSQTQGSKVATFQVCPTGKSLYRE